MYPEFEYYKYKTGKLRFDGNPGFNTLSGRVELFCNMYNNVGMDPLPYFKEPPEEAPEVREAPASILAPTWVLIGATIFFGVFTSLSVGVASAAARALLGAEL